MPFDYIRVRLARATAADWAAKNTMLDQGEPGFEFDTGKLKIGDGKTRWLDLEYFYPGLPVPDPDGASDAAVLAHIQSTTPHPIYDDGPSLVLLYRNAQV